MITPTLAVLLLLVDLSLNDARQMTACLHYADAHRIEVRGLTHDEEAAVQMVGCREVDSVLIATEPYPGLPVWLTSRIEAFGGHLLVARRRIQVIRDAADVRGDMIRTALANSGGDHRLVARLLGISESTVRAAQSRAAAGAGAADGVRARRINGAGVA